MAKNKKPAAPKEPELVPLSGFEAEQLEAVVLANLPAIAKRWFPSGRLIGVFWSAPHPADISTTLSIDLFEGRWREFPSGKSGRTVISLIQHLTGLNENVVWHRLKTMMDGRSC